MIVGASRRQHQVSVREQIRRRRALEPGGVLAPEVALRRGGPAHICRSMACLRLGMRAQIVLFCETFAIMSDRLAAPNGGYGAPSAVVGARIDPSMR